MAKWQRPRPDPNRLDGPEAALAKLIDIGRRDPVEWVRLSFGCEPSNQQKDALQRVADLEKALLMKHKNIPLPPELEQYSGKMGISIRSGNGTGKDCLMAWLIIRMVVCFPRPKGLATAPAAHQLESIVWSEVTRWLNTRNDRGEYACPFRDLVTVQATKIFWKPGGGKDSFIEPRTASQTATEEAQSETLAGRHEDYLCVFCTEASGVPDAVFKPLERTLTGMCNYAILIWNPTRTRGYAHRTHFSEDRHSWVCLHWDAEESDRVSKEHIARLERKFGRDSNMFRIGVKGIPPVAEKGTLIPYEIAAEAVGREFDIPEGTPARLGNDIGRSGDKSSTVCRVGPVVEFAKQYQKDDLTVVASVIAGEIAEVEPEAVMIDVNGLGWGVFDILRRNRILGLHPVNVTRQPNKPDQFYQLRDELYWEMRQAFMEGRIGIKPGPWVEDLLAELTTLRYDDDVLKPGVGKKVIKIWSKRQMKQKGLPSPNMADGLAITFYLPDDFFGKKKKPIEDEGQDRWKERFKNARSHRDTSWMSN